MNPKDVTQKRKWVIALTIGVGVVLFAILIFLYSRPKKGAQTSTTRSQFYATLSTASQSFFEYIRGIIDPQ